MTGRHAAVINMPAFRRRTFDVQAVKWDGTLDGSEEILKWVGSLGFEGHYSPVNGADYSSTATIFIATIGFPKQTYWLRPNQWLVWYPNGTFVVMYPTDFDDEFEEIR